MVQIKRPGKSKPPAGGYRAKKAETAARTIWAQLVGEKLQVQDSEPTAIAAEVAKLYLNAWPALPDGTTFKQARTKVRPQLNPILLGQLKESRALRDEVNARFTHIEEILTQMRHQAHTQYVGDHMVALTGNDIRSIAIRRYLETYLNVAMDVKYECKSRIFRCGIVDKRLENVAKEVGETPKQVVRISEAFVNCREALIDAPLFTVIER